ncbi:MAG: hypothetical protein DYG86_12445 [Chloroflexi bacterium CFX2]|nr:hypothetical protein [Chloroflexi bacterium CFX2]
MKNLFLALTGCLTLTVACNLGVPTPGNESAQTGTPLAPPELESSTPAFFSTESAPSTPVPPPPYFTEEFDIPSPYWKFLQAAGGQAPSISTGNGSLRIDQSSPDAWMIGIQVVHSYSNVFIRAKASVKPGGSVGLICRYNESSGWYEFNVASDGTYSLLLGQWLSPGVVKYIPLVRDGHKFSILDPGIELGLFCEDGFLHLYLDGSAIRHFDATNYGLTSGNVGFAAASFTEIPMTATLEWISIKDK